MQTPQNYEHIVSDLFLLGATMGLRLEEVYKLGLLSDGPLHFHLLMGVHSLQVELSEHHYRHEFLFKYFTSHREGDRRTGGGGGVLCNMWGRVGLHAIIKTKGQNKRGEQDCKWSLSVHRQCLRTWLIHHLHFYISSYSTLYISVYVAAPGCSPAGIPGQSSPSSAGQFGPTHPATPGSNGRCEPSGHPSAAGVSPAVDVKQLLLIYSIWTMWHCHWGVLQSVAYKVNTRYGSKVSHCHYDITTQTKQMFSSGFLFFLSFAAKAQITKD